MTAAGVKEWPEPTALTVIPSSSAVRRISTTSEAVRGVTTLAAFAVWLPAQLDHSFAPATPHPILPPARQP